MTSAGTIQELGPEPDLSAGAARLRALESACRLQLASAQQPPERRARLHDRLGRLLYGQVRFDEAAEQYTAALQAWPRLAAAAHNRAIVRYRMGCFREAERDLLLAQSLEPDNPEIATGLRETRQLLCGEKQQQQQQQHDPREVAAAAPGQAATG